MLDLLILQPTPFCNINCDYCYLPNRLSNNKMSLDLIHHIFCNLFESHLVASRLSVIWHAGEPLVLPVSYYQAAFKTIQNLNLNHCHISHAIQTNGTLINQEWCDLIREHNLNIGVSLDGPAFIHDAHRKTRNGKGTHATAMQGIALLQQNEIDFHVIAVLTRQSLHFPDEIFDFFIRHGIRRIGFNIEEIEGANATSSLSGQGMDEQYVRFMERLYTLAQPLKHELSIREFEEAERQILSGVNIGRSYQSTPYKIISINCHGEFSTFSPELLGLESSVYGDFILGNIHHTTFAAGLASAKFRTMNRHIEAGIERCKATCEYFDLCGGGAPANKYFENGSFDSTETMYCRYTIQTPVNLVLSELEKRLQRC